MKTCKVRPSTSECRMCMDTCTPNCAHCGYDTIRYELLQIVSGIFNDYAYVQRDGKISKAYLENVYDIREE